MQVFIQVQITSGYVLNIYFFINGILCAKFKPVTKIINTQFKYNHEYSFSKQLLPVFLTLCHRELWIVKSNLAPFQYQCTLKKWYGNVIYNLHICETKRNFISHQRIPEVIRIYQTAKALKLRLQLSSIVRTWSLFFILIYEVILIERIYYLVCT